MATGPGVPGASNVFVPNWAASGRLATGYSRNAKSFLLPQYCQYVQSPKVVGLWLKLSAQEAARVVSTNDYLWAWGANRPLRDDGLETFNLKEFAVLRHDYGFNLDEDTERQAEWEVGEQHAQIHAAKGMTDRTIEAISVLTTTTNWTVAGGTDGDLSADHTAAAPAFAGGFTDQGTSTAPYIKIFLDKAANLILLDTLSVVEPDKLMVIMNPNCARLWAESPEIHEYIKGSPAAIDEIRSGSSPNARYGPGLPSSVYGYKIRVESTVKVTSRKGDALAKSFAFPDKTVAVVSRTGELDGVYGLPSFSTFTMFWYRDDMTLERFEDVRNRRFEYSLVDARVFKLTSPLSGFLLTNATSVAS